jgi:hypothetical protein
MEEDGVGNGDGDVEGQGGQTGYRQEIEETNQRELDVQVKVVVVVMRIQYLQYTINHDFCRS